MTLGGKAMAAVFVVALAAGGCGAVEDPTSTAQRTGTTSPTSTTSTEPVARPQVDVVDAGAAPRSRLSLTLSEGDSQRSTMTMTMGMQISMNGRKAPAVDVPAMSMGMVVDITDVSDDGVVSAGFGYDDVDVDGDTAVARELEEKLAVIKGVHGTLQMTETGEFIAADLELPDDLDPTMQTTLNSMEDQLSSMMVPLPAEPVGVGARWTVHTETQVNGVQASLEAQYRLVEREGDHVVLQVSYVQTADDQVMEVPGAPTGVVSHLKSMHMAGTGRTVIDLGHPLPVQSHLQVSGNMRMTVEQGNQHMDMVQRLRIGMELEPRS